MPAARHATGDHLRQPGLVVTTLAAFEKVLEDAHDTEGLLKVGSSLLDFRNHQSAWIRIMAKTYRDHIILVGLGHVGCGQIALLVVRGEARVSRKGLEVGTLGPGAHFGELALVTGAPRAASVVAATALTLGRLRLARMLRRYRLLEQRGGLWIYGP